MCLIVKAEGMNVILPPLQMNENHSLSLQNIAVYQARRVPEQNSTGFLKEYATRHNIRYGEGKRVMFTLELAGKAQRGSRSTALLFLQPRCQMMGEPRGQSGRVRKSRPHRPARSKSLYQIRYSGTPKDSEETRKLNELNYQNSTELFKNTRTRFCIHHVRDRRVLKNGNETRFMLTVLNQMRDT